jgi:hypothetical protein
MASFISCQRSGCAVCGGDGRPCAIVPVVSAVEDDDPGAPGGLVAFVEGALPESIFGAAASGALAEPVELPAAVVASLLTDLAPASGDGAGVDFTEAASCAGGWGVGTASFGGSGAGMGAVEGGTSLVATRLEESLGNSMW